MKNVKGFDKLRDLKQSLEEQRNKEYEESRNRQLANRNALYSRSGFKSGDEVIKWVLDGNKIVDEHDCYTFMYLKGDRIIHIFEDYDECAGPLGYTSKSMSIEDFKSWVHRVESRKDKKEKFFPNWLKSTIQKF